MAEEGSSPSPDDADAAQQPADAAGESGQDDVDALEAGAPAGGATEDSGGEPQDDSLSQADIDAALSGDAAKPDERPDSAGGPLDEASSAVSGGAPPEISDFGGRDERERLVHDIDLLHDVNLRVKIELGRTRMAVEDVLKLGEGSVVELDKLAGDPVDVFANGRLIARGEVLVLNDNFCVRVNEIVSGVHQAAGVG